AVIYLTMPLLTSHIGYWQARRSLLYVLPSYCFIGLGMKQIFDGIIRVGGRIKWTGTIILAGALGLILISEGGILRGRILTRQDIGLLPLAEKIREMGLEGDLYYVERKNPGYYTKMGDVSMARGINSLYEADFESDVLSLALMDHGQTLPTVRGLGVKSPLPAAAPAHFYIVQSPLVAGNEFERWCSRNRIRHRLIFELKPVDLPRGEARLVCGPFKLFDAIRG
ncbi:MAG: hypothetical protein KGJ11_09690, partial [Candidatus Omnitrophica bacterium]|nr:hypothetical protein [Candidatus Omnitrophota bacterium]